MDFKKNWPFAQGHKPLCSKSCDLWDKKSPGRPKLLSNRTKRRILGEISNSTTSVRKLKNELSLNVSKDTIHRVIKSLQHLVRQKPKACPVLTDAHKKARLQFATQHITWTHQWSTVIFGHLRI